jgi:hypothetical protein
LDSWGGSRQHTFTVLFGLKSPPAAGECSLDIRLLDTQSQSPPVLRVQVNGRNFQRPLAPGAGDESINGRTTSGKPQTVSFRFPLDVLRVGDNAIQITILSGSWLLYDALQLSTSAGTELTAVRQRTVLEQVHSLRALKDRGGNLLQPILITLRHFGSGTDARIRVESAEPRAVHLTNGLQTIELLVPPARTDENRRVSVEIAEVPFESREVKMKPPRKLTVYVLPHSHTDIGYTEIQTAIEKKQVNNLLQGIQIARQTADNVEGARFVWNVEVLWAADLYLQRLSEAERADFFDAVRKGQIALNGMYLNELTGLCRPEELVRLFHYSGELSRRCNAVIDSAMISDVPGYTWGTVTAMAQAGIRYFSVAPNFFDRIGNILVEWENKPFYWVSPSGNEKVLVWIPYKGYAMSHIYKRLTPEFVAQYQDELKDYPYDVSYMRWSGHGDNAPPDPEICSFIQQWTTNYAWPRFVISSTSEAFRAFEKRYGDRIPQVKGDWTPYWEDGAGSSALETAMNRATADRLTQAATLYAMLDPKGYPAAEFDEVWKNVLLYSEHTWGASCSVTDPGNPKTKEQWEIKRGYAVRADRQSRNLLARILGRNPPSSSSPACPVVRLNSDEAEVPSAQPVPDRDAKEEIRTAKPEFDLFNTASWSRSELVLLPPELVAGSDIVSDDHGESAPCQRLTTGELAFLAHVPPLAARRYSLSTGSSSLSVNNPASIVPARVTSAYTLENGLLLVRLDGRTGGIVELRAKGIDWNLADTSSGEALNDYLYLAGNNLADLKRSGTVNVSIKEPGPLVAAFLIESDAPGCRKLQREIRLVAGSDHVELIDVVDKAPSPANPKPGDWRFAQTGGKESLNFAFAFNVPDGEMQLDIPLGAMRPEQDQIPGSCKNWFTVGRWVDVANQDFGVTWITLDAPLIEIGDVTATLLGSQTNPKVWRKKVPRSQRLYSWVMNNHWHTNYRASQDGRVAFRYALRPHRQPSPADSARLAIALSQPLLPGAIRSGPPVAPILRISSDEVIVQSLQPAESGEALTVRLFGASGRPADISLTSPGIRSPIHVSGWDLVTLRAELGK